MKIVKPSVKLLWITPEPEKQIEIAGRTCYKSEDKITTNSAFKFCKKLRESGHHAMLEHASASFRIITDRGITHEIVRHRLASYAQESTRYCNYGSGRFDGECTFIEPPLLAGEDHEIFVEEYGYPASQKEIWIRSCEEAEEKYLLLIKAGCSPQIARSVLPNCLKTEIVMTANLREWMHFIKLRSVITAHPQIRPIAKRINGVLHTYVPSLFDFMEPDFFLTRDKK